MESLGYTEYEEFDRTSRIFQMMVPTEKSQKLFKQAYNAYKARCERNWVTVEAEWYEILHNILLDSKFSEEYRYAWENRNDKSLIKKLKREDLKAGLSGIAKIIKSILTFVSFFLFMLLTNDAHLAWGVIGAAVTKVPRTLTVATINFSIMLGLAYSQDYYGYSVMRTIYEFLFV